MKLHTRRRLGALAQIAFLLAAFRWSGWYGLLEPIPWVPAIGMALFFTAITLRLRVLLERNY